MSEPDDTDDARSEIQEERRDEAEERNPDLHGEALEAIEGNEDGSGRTLG
ncbi:hypothetical protein [uncultured Jatrophihabitans sp.]